jgi:hypothetical protein
MEALVHGFRYLQLLGPLRDRLHADGAARDRAGNRGLFLDRYLGLLLLYFFSPALRWTPLSRPKTRRSYLLLGSSLLGPACPAAGVR